MTGIPCDCSDPFWMLQRIFVEIYDGVGYRDDMRQGFQYHNSVSQIFYEKNVLTCLHANLRIYP